MTPAEYVARLKALMTSGQNQGALDLAAAFQGRVHPPLSPRQLDLIGGALESAATMVDLEQMESAQAEARTA